MGRPIFIAEASSNHGRELSRALAFVDAAADAGCDAVKFQLFKIDRMFAPEILSRSAKHRARKRLGAAARSSGPACRTLFAAPNSVLLHALLPGSRGRASPLCRLLQDRVLRIAGRRSARSLRRDRKAGRALHRHGDDGGNPAARSQPSKMPAPPTSRCSIASRPIRRRPAKRTFPPSPPCAMPPAARSAGPITPAVRR